MGVLIGSLFGLGLLLICLAVLRAPVPPRAGSAGEGPAGLLRSAGLGGTHPGVLLAGCAALGLLGFLTTFAVSRTLPVALVFCAMTSYAPIAMVRGAARRRRRELADVWPEVVDHLASAVRAGLSLPEAVSQLGERGPEPLRAPFRAFAADYLATGRFGDCLDRLKQRLADPVGDRVVESLRIAREVGGGELGRVLRTLSAFLRDDARTRGELESRQAWTVNGARLAVAAPWLVLLALSFHSEVVRRYASAAGLVVLTGGLVVCVVAYRLMIRIGRLPEDSRVLS